MVGFRGPRPLDARAASKQPAQAPRERSAARARTIRPPPLPVKTSSGALPGALAGLLCHRWLASSAERGCGCLRSRCPFSPTPGDAPPVLPVAPLAPSPALPLLACRACSPRFAALDSFHRKEQAQGRFRRSQAPQVRGLAAVSPTAARTAVPGGSAGSIPWPNRCSVAPPARSLRSRRLQRRRANLIAGRPTCRLLHPDAGLSFPRASPPAAYFTSRMYFRNSASRSVRSSPKQLLNCASRCSAVRSTSGACWACNCKYLTNACSFRRSKK